jgi:hypothetical protein
MLNNKDFYPTPYEVIETMTQGLELQGKNILEPSAGKGDIIEYLKKQGANVFACEIDENLQIFVKTKATKFLGADFLELTPEKISHVDYVIMNPPFTNDETHLLHAWDIAPQGSIIISLINYETYRNDYTSKRTQLKQIIANYGTCENIGNVFENAERVTNVDIGLVRIYKPLSESQFESSFFDLTEEQEHDTQGIISYNEINEIVGRYVGAVKTYDKMTNIALEMHELIGNKLGMTNLCFTLQDNDNVNISRERFKIDLQRNCWRWIFNKMKMEKYTTSDLEQQLNNFCETQKKVPFTVKNIYKMFELIVGTHKDRMNKALITVVDKITAHHADNRMNVEGWKTNSSYMLNQKFILENAVRLNWSNKIESGYNSNLLDDFTKALCYLTGEDYSKCTRFGKKHYNSFLDNVNRGIWYGTTFFSIKVFKKGTAHIVFKDENLCRQVNITVAKLKGYPLPEYF